MCVFKRFFSLGFAVFNFYLQGFRAMKLGKTLWLVILIKLFVMFFVLKAFIFNTNFKSIYKDEASQSQFVLENLTKTKE